MKNFLRSIFVLIIFLCSPFTLAIEEVILNIEGEIGEDEELINDNNVIDDSEWPFDIGGKTLQQKLEEIRQKEHKNIAKRHYLFEEILTKNFENSPIQSMHLFGQFKSSLCMDFYPDDNDLTYELNDIDLGVNGKFKGGKSYYEARLRFNPQNRYSFLQYMPSNLYVATTAIPHHTIIFGNTRTATGHEGAKSSAVIPTIARSQISRNFGNTRKVGTRIKGDYSLLEYDLGGFSSDTYFREFFPGAEFAGWITLKPLGKTNGKYGRLKIGSGITAGQNDINYNVAGAYASYEYKKLYANFEWAKANGYNGSRGLSSKDAEGLYSTLAYRITPKLQLVTRYDQYTPNLEYSQDIRREYTAGANYFIKGQAMKLMLNYVYCQNDVIEDSHRIILGTQLLL